MSKSREELRRGIRSLIQDTQRRMRDVEGGPSTPGKPLLPRPEDLAPAGDPSAAAPPEDARRADNVRYIQPSGQRAGGDPDMSGRDDAPARAVLANLEELSQYDERKGVCFAFFVNRRCWEVPEAYCNHALHICMLRNCPVYHLHREDLDRRFAAKFKHLW